MSWSQPTVTGDIPNKRAAHAGCAVNGTLYLFGGMNETGPLDDLYSLNTGTRLSAVVRYLHNIKTATYLRQLSSA